MDLNIFKYTPFHQKDVTSKGQILTTEQDLKDISSRLLNNDGSFNVVRKGFSAVNTYQSLMTVSRTKFLIAIVTFFITLNLGFALLFTLHGVEYLYIDPTNFWNDWLQAFYFSVQTFSTLGYGKMAPSDHFTNILASIDAFTGVMTVALLTGLFFARFSKPKAYISFSNKILIAPERSGNKSLQFRIVHDVKHKIIDLEARVTLTWLENDGNRIRRMFVRLPLKVDRIFLFPLNWTLIHEINDESPLKNLDKNQIMDRNAEFLIVIKGYDETYSTTVHADRSYHTSDLVYGAQFLPMYHIRTNDTVLDLDKLHDYTPYDFDDSNKV